MKKDNDNFLIALSCSLAIHLFIAYFFIFGLPSYFKPLPVEEVITFEMLPISAISNVPTKKVQQESKAVVEEAKKVEKSAREEKPVEEKPKEPEQPLEKEEKPEAEIIEKKKEEKPKEEPKPKKEEPKKVEKPKEKKKKQISNNELDSLLKNLEQASEGEKDKSSKKAMKGGEANEKESKGPYNEDRQLSISDRAVIKSQIEKLWKIPAGAENIEKVRVVLYIKLDMDGTVLEVTMKDQICGTASRVSCHLVAESALRAVKQASPIQGLPLDTYDSWKEFNFYFDPSNMVR